MPDLGPLPKARDDLVTYKDGKSYYTYPSHDWWKIYNDSQLNGLIEEGLAQSPSINEAVARIHKASAQALAAGASLAPAVNFDGSISKYRQSYDQGFPPALIPHGFLNLAAIKLDFDYELDFWGKNSDSLAAAMSEVEAAKLMAIQAKILLSTSIAARYANLAQYYAELDVSRENVAVRKQTLDLFDRRHKNGLENESSVEQSKSNLAAAQADLAAVEENISLLCNSLTALIGATPSRAQQIKRPSLEMIDSVGVPKVIPADLIGRRPDIVAAQLTLEAAASRINVASAGFYPNINLTGYIGYQSLGLDTFLRSSSLIGAVGPAIHLPIFNAGYIEGQYRSSRADYDASLASYESAIIQALREVADAVTSHQSLELRAQKTTVALNAAERAYEISKNRYKGGLSTYLEVLRAEDNLIASRRAMVQMRARAFVLDVALVKAVGGGFKSVNKIKEEL